MAVVVLSPGSTGVVPDAFASNMHVGGSKGSISGNFAMADAELLIVVVSRAVCQADCSGIGYKSAKHVININGDLDDVSHYNNTLALPGDITAVTERLSSAPEPMRIPQALVVLVKGDGSRKVAIFDSSSVIAPPSW